MKINYHVPITSVTKLKIAQSSKRVNTDIFLKKNLDR